MGAFCRLLNASPSRFAAVRIKGHMPLVVAAGR